MCLILFALDADPRYRLVVAANRDELYTRPSAPAQFWADHPTVCAGRDLLHGGTWLGVSTAGRIGAITNFRQGLPQPGDARSRGALVGTFVQGASSASDYAAAVQSRGGEYNGFSLIVGDRDSFHFVSNRASAPMRVEPGLHGLSNALLDTPWPKVERGKAAVAAALELPDEGALVERLFAHLADRTGAVDSELPDTGVGIERERWLAPAFIANERYGTRSSTVVLVGRDGKVLFAERSFGIGGVPLGRVEHRFALAD
jgi:uncharacterized protein with NRDE domain